MNLQNEPVYLSFVNYVDSLKIADELKNFIKDESFIKENPLFYLKYSYLFANALNINDKVLLNDLSIAGYLYYKSIILMDHLYDTINKPQSPYLIIGISTCQEECIKILSHYFSKESVFWKFWDQRKTEYLKAITIEKETNIESQFEFTQYEKLADLKSAFGKVAIDSLYSIDIKNNDNDVYEKLIESHKLFSIAFQLCDDVKDIKEDFENKQFNWAYKETNDLLAEMDIISHSINEINKYLYLKGVAKGIYKKALEYYTRAISVLNDIDASEWTKVINARIKQLKNDIDTIDEYIAISTEKAKLLNPVYIKKGYNIEAPHLNNPGSQIFNDALLDIYNEWERNYGELQHVMYFGEKEGFTIEKRVQTGDIFQRAIITEILLDVNNKKPIHGLDVIINHELDYLKDNQVDGGGWSYFPTVQEIAVDADDLGQIIQCFIKGSRIDEIRENCSKLLGTLFKDNAPKDDGSFETWIIPKIGRTKIQEKQDYFNNTKWGKGPDNEVMANLLYGLTLFAPKDFKTEIKNGCVYLEKNQNSSGAWESRWYYGNYYGTYTCLRLFESAAYSSDSVKKAIDFILSSQNGDGGWGFKDGISDPLNTSLALLCLSFNSINHRNQIEHGLTFLKLSQNKSNKWDGIPFIKPKAGQPYKSSTITAAYVLKAINALI